VDLIAAADLEEGEVVEQSVVVALDAGGDGHVPEALDEEFCVGRISGEGADGGHGEEAGRVVGGEGFAVESEGVGSVRALRREDREHAGALLDLP